MKLKKFVTKTEKRKRTIIISSIIACLLVAGIVLYRSYALYQESKSYDVLKGTVPRFGNSIELAFTIDGEENSSAFPNKGDGYVANNVTCDNGVTASWDNDNWALSNINSNNQTKIKCTINFVKESLSTKAKVGNYVRMTPNSTIYTISQNLTGFDYDQEMDPSKVNLWRIIAINNNSVTLVSEIVDFFSGDGIPEYALDLGFKSSTGTNNYSTVLDNIANQFKIEKYSFDPYVLEESDATTVKNALGTLNTFNNDDYFLQTYDYTQGPVPIVYDNEVHYDDIYYGNSSGVRLMGNVNGTVGIISGSGTSEDPFVLE